MKTEARKDKLASGQRWPSWARTLVVAPALSRKLREKRTGSGTPVAGAGPARERARSVAVGGAGVQMAQGGRVLAMAVVLALAPVDA